MSSAVSTSNAGEVRIDFSPTVKQHKAWSILNDSKTNILYYGGAALQVAGKPI